MAFLVPAIVVVPVRCRDEDKDRRPELPEMIWLIAAEADVEAAAVTLATALDPPERVNMPL